MSQQNAYETRAQRRERAREAAKLLLKRKNQAGEGVHTKDIVLWCLAGVMAVALYLAPEKTPLWVILSLLCMAALATHPVLNLHWVTKAASGKSRAIRSLTAISGMAVLVGLYGWFVWPLSHRHELNQRERYAFEKPLKQQKEPREEIQIACPQAEESTCVYAAQFINLFREAGWKVQGNAVQRGVLGAPLAGVILVKHGTGTID